MDKLLGTIIGTLTGLMIALALAAAVKFLWLYLVFGSTGTSC